MVTTIARKASTLGSHLFDRVKPSGQRGTRVDRSRHQVACLIAVVWWLLLGMILAAAQPQSIPGEAVRVGHQYFVRYCSACHGVEGRGDGPAASALQPPPANLTRIAQRHDGLFPVADISAAINGRTVIPAHGSREMPIRGARLGEMAGGGAAGEAVVQAVLRIRIDDLQALQH
jgi:mono/diheme cytochrome c family protein